MRPLTGFILQICLTTAVRQTLKAGSEDSAILCKPDIHVFYEGINETGDKVFDQLDFEPDEYDIMGGKTIFYKFSANQTDRKPTRYMIGCDWASRIPVLMAIKEPDENGEGGEWSIGRFYTWHVEFQVRLKPGERVEFAMGTFEYNIFTSGRFRFRDGTGLWFNPKALEKASQEQEMALRNTRESGAKICTQTVVLHLTGTTHTGPNSTAEMKGKEVKFAPKTGPNSTAEMKGKEVKFAPKDYMKVGGLKIMRKYVPGEVNRFSMRYEKLAAVQEKRYWIRCNYDNGSPILVMHEQGGEWDIRPFDMWHLWKREVSIKDQWRLDFLADFAVAFEVSHGNVVMTLEDESSL